MLELKTIRFASILLTLIQTVPRLTKQEHVQNAPFNTMLTAKLMFVQQFLFLTVTQWTQQTHYVLNALFITNN